MVKLLYVCVTCDRNAAHDGPTHGAGRRLAREFAGALASTPADDLAVREVACLNGCPQPCNVSLRGVHRHTLRFSRVDGADCAALIAFARAYWTAVAGDDGLAAMPAVLRAKLTVCTAPPKAPHLTT